MSHFFSLSPYAFANTGFALSKLRVIEEGEKIGREVKLVAIMHCYD